MTPAPLPPPQNRTAQGFLLGAVVALGIFSVLGMVGGAVGFSWIQKTKSDVRKGWNLVPIVVAAVDIPENAIVTMEMISQRSVPEQFVTSSVVKPDSASYIVNQKIMVASQAGDPLLWSQFETTRAAERLSDRLEAQARIFSIKTDGPTGVSGLIHPNDHVDVIAVFTAPDTRELTAMTLLENVPVLATGQITGSTNINLLALADRKYTEVSVSVTPEDAERLALMASLGTLTLTIRNPLSPSTRPKSPKLGVKTLLSR